MIAAPEYKKQEVNFEMQVRNTCSLTDAVVQGWLRKFGCTLDVTGAVVAEDDAESAKHNDFRRTKRAED